MVGCVDHLLRSISNEVLMSTTVVTHAPQRRPSSGLAPANRTCIDPPQAPRVQSVTGKHELSWEGESRSRGSLFRPSLDRGPGRSDRCDGRLVTESERRVLLAKADQCALYERIDERVRSMIVAAHKEGEAWHFCSDLLSQIERDGADEAPRMRAIVLSRLKDGRDYSASARRGIGKVLAMCFPQDPDADSACNANEVVLATAKLLIAAEKSTSFDDEREKWAFLSTWRVIVEKANALGMETSNEGLLDELATCLKQLATDDVAKQGWMVSAFQFFPFEIRHRYGYAGQPHEFVHPPSLAVKPELKRLMLVVFNVLRGRSEPQQCRWTIHGALESLLDFAGGSAAEYLKRHVRAETDQFFRKSASVYLESWYRDCAHREDLERLLERARQASKDPLWPNEPAHTELVGEIIQAITRLDLAAREAFPET